VTVGGTAAPQRRGTPARPLVVRFGAMGDLVIVLTLIEALHRRFGTPVDVVASGAWAKPLLEGQPGVGEVYLIRSRRTPYVLSPQQWRLVRALRARGPGPVWLCDYQPQALALLRRAGVTDEWLLQVEKTCPILPTEHHMDRWLRFAQQSPAALPPVSAETAAHMVRGITAPPLRVLPHWRAELDAWLRAKGLAERPLVLIQAVNKRMMRKWLNPRRASNTKYWPEERWAAVVESLLQDDPRAAVLLLGVPAEAPVNDDIARLVHNERLINIAREMSIPKLLALQERAVGMISVDTGPAHSAAALDCPLVVLFGQKGKPHRYGQRSPHGPVERLTGRIGAGPSILGISVQDVLHAWARAQRAAAARARQSAP